MSADPPKPGPKLVVDNDGREYVALPKIVGPGLKYGPARPRAVIDLGAVRAGKEREVDALARLDQLMAEFHQHERDGNDKMMHRVGQHMHVGYSRDEINAAARKYQAKRRDELAAEKLARKIKSVVHELIGVPPESEPVSEEGGFRREYQDLVFVGPEDKEPA